MQPHALTEQERFDCLRLARSEQIGPANYRRLIRRYGSAGEALVRLPDLAKGGGRSRPLAAAPVKAVESSADPIDGVAAAVGFGDPERMRRAFIRAFGQPPQALRRTARSVGSLQS